MHRQDFSRGNGVSSTANTESEKKEMRIDAESGLDELKLPLRVLNALQEEGHFFVGDLFRIRFLKCHALRSSSQYPEPHEWWTLKEYGSLLGENQEAE